MIRTPPDLLKSSSTKYEENRGKPLEDGRTCMRSVRGSFRRRSTRTHRTFGRRSPSWRAPGRPRCGPPGSWCSPPEPEIHVNDQQRPKTCRLSKVFTERADRNIATMTSTSSCTYDALEDSVCVRIANGVDDAGAVDQKYPLHQRYILPHLHHI